MNGALRILLVDDEAILAWTMNRMLTAHGHTVSAFTDPTVALAEARQAQFDVLISDVRMPGLSGIALATHMREWQPECKIILLSGQANALHSVVVKEGSPFTLLRKPLRPEELLDLVGGMSR